MNWLCYMYFSKMHIGSLKMQTFHSLSSVVSVVLSWRVDSWVTNMHPPVASRVRYSDSSSQELATGYTCSRIGSSASLYSKWPNLQFRPKIGQIHPNKTNQIKTKKKKTTKNKKKKKKTAWLHDHN